MRRARVAGAGRGRNVPAELVARALTRAPALTPAAPHVRARVGTDRLLAWFILASAPAVLVGCWSLGAALASASPEAGEGGLGGWRAALAAGGAADGPAGVLASLGLGLSYFVPILTVAVVVAVAWETAFAVWRERPADPGIFMTAWLFAALSPATLPLPLAALGMSFGVVLGSKIFGGTGRYLVSPALLGAVFLSLAYPAVFDPRGAVPATALATTWSELATDGAAALEAAGRSWLAIFAGREVDLLGTSSALACLAGAGVLAVRGAASWRTLAGGLLGLWLASGLGADTPIPGRWHLAVGSFAFCLAFVATDPTTLPLTRLGRWLHGAAIGALVVAIRMLNPAHPEGSLAAILIAALFTPIFDHAVVAWHARVSRAERGP